MGLAGMFICVYIFFVQPQYSKFNHFKIFLQARFNNSENRTLWRLNPDAIVIDRWTHVEVMLPANVLLHIVFAGIVHSGVFALDDLTVALKNDMHCKLNM